MMSKISHAVEIALTRLTIVVTMESTKMRRDTSLCVLNAYARRPAKTMGSARLIHWHMAVFTDRILVLTCPRYVLQEGEAKGYLCC